MKKILFVCTGNTCRSPMAEAIFKSYNPPMEIISRGLFADGSPYSENAVSVLADIGIDVAGGVSKLISYEDLTADRIFCMTPSQREMLLELGADDDKIRVLNVMDPYGHDVEEYRICRDQIKEIIDNLVFDIRPFEEKDAAAVARIESYCFSHPWSEQALIESFNANTKFFVAENLTRVIGYGGVSLVADEAYVTNIAVLEDYRNLYAGQYLLEALIEYAKKGGASFISLEVRESNAPAIALYEKNGFKTVGHRKNFYDDPKEDAIIMTKEF